MGHSFEIPEYTSEVTGLGTLRVLEAMRFLGLKKTKFYQASTSELLGEKPNKVNSFNEKSLMIPKSPYGVSKLYSYFITKVYREAYGFFACNGILFNHESPRRGETFVTRKITMAAARIVNGHQDILYIGNLDAERDWGHAKDYVYGMWLMLQQDKPDDFVLSTGEKTSVRDFINLVFDYLGIKIKYKGSGDKEYGVVSECNSKYKLEIGKKIVEVDPKYYRPAEVELLLGDARKAKKVLGWESKTDIDELVKIMVDYDLAHNDYGFD